MKKLIYCAAALATMIFAGSCQQEILEPVAQENTVTYTVELPDVQTKAIGDASTVDQLIYEVWVTKAADERDLTNPDKATRLYQDETTLIQRNGKTCAVVTFNLVQDQEYTILFWAQKKGTGVYNTDVLTDVHYATNFKPGESGYFSNQENYAAFYAADFVSDEDTKSRTVILKRPFAQLNIATKNTVEDYTVTLDNSRVVLSNVATHFDVAQNLPESPAVSEFSKIEFKAAEVPTDPKTLTVNGQTYHYVAMNYIFANGNTEVSYEINTTLVSHSDANTTTTAKISNNVPNVPLKENYRTNIVGNLLTSTTEYYIEIDDSWYDEPGDGTEVEVWDELYTQEPYYNEKAGQYEISLASELAWLSAAVNGTLVDPELDVKSTGYQAKRNFSGETFKLMEDIDLKGTLWTPIGINSTAKNGDVFQGTFDGNGKTIKNLTVKSEGNASAGLFANSQGVIKNLYVDGANITGNYKAGVIVGDGLCSKIENCHVKNAVVVSTPYNNDDANHVGGIVGYLSAENEAYVKNSSVKDATITGYRDVAAIAGTANEAAVVTGNNVENVTVVADQTAEYKEVKAANVDAIAGRVGAKATVAENEIGDNVVVYILVKNATQLQNALNLVNAGTTEIRFAADIKGNVTVDQQEGKNIVINGNNKMYDGTITIDGNSRNNGAETLVIKNVNFKTDKQEYVYFIEQNSAQEAVRYAHNITIEDCTFEGAEYGVGARFRQCYNVVFRNCEVISGHSLAQLYGCAGVTVENVVVKNVAEGGISFGQSTNCVVNGFSVTESPNAIYGIRADADDDKGATTLNIKNVNITAKLPVIARYYDNPAYQINFEGENTLTAPGYQVVLTTGKDNATFVAPAEYAQPTGVEKFCVFPGTDKIYAYSAAELQYLLNNAKNGDTIELAADIDGDVTATQKENVNITIDGRNYNYAGVITVDGKSATYTTAGLTIKDLAFKAETISADACIRLGDGTNATRYTCNVTVDGCTFEVPGAVGVKSYTGGDKNLTITECTATAKAHSLVQAKGIDGITVSGCTVNSKNGMNFNNSTNVIVDNCTADVKGYAARFGESSGGSGAAEVYEIKNSKLKSACNDGDAVIVLRGTADNSTLNINNTTLEGAIEITNTASNAKVYVDGEYILTSVSELNEALTEGGEVVLSGNVAISSSEAGSNGYGATGISQLNGGTIDGQGNSISVDAWTTWDSAINTTGGTIKNLYVTGGMRGIFVNHNSDYSAKVILENVTIDGTIYTISCDQGTNNGLEATNSTFNGWTSYAATLGDVKFDGCSFGEGQGYAFCRPYAATEFANCAFEAGYEIDPRAAVTFENCTIGGVELTAANVATLVTSNIANVASVNGYTQQDGLWIKEGTAIVTSPDKVEAALDNTAINTIYLNAGEYTIEMYANFTAKESLRIIGTEGTKVAFSNGQVKLDLAKNFTIENCEILHMATKSWGMLVFATGASAEGVYTVSNCTFNGVGTQGIYINETYSGAVYNIDNCTFKGDFGSEGAVTIQNNAGVNFTVNITDCEFKDIPATSHETYFIYNNTDCTLNKNN